MPDDMAVQRFMLHQSWKTDMYTSASWATLTVPQLHIQKGCKLKHTGTQEVGTTS